MIKGIKYNKKENVPQYATKKYYREKLIIKNGENEIYRKLIRTTFFCCKKLQSH